MLGNVDSAEGMVRVIREVYKLKDKKVLKALLTVPREKFVPIALKELAYSDNALSIGYGQTISQPYTVAYMTHLLRLEGNEKVLEIGTGSGYQAAVLSKLAKKVYSAEVIKKLGEKAEKRLKRLGFDNVGIRTGNGEVVWEDKAPFDRIIITAGVYKKLPKKIIDQLKDGGFIVVPIGDSSGQVMTRFTKKGKKVTSEEFGIFQFVPYKKN
jgi:protein-L-isoaspartate(D-aspartate) O-methyltransferase